MRNKGKDTYVTVVSSLLDPPDLILVFFFFLASSLLSSGFASVSVTKRSVAIKIKKRMLARYCCDELGVC